MELVERGRHDVCSTASLVSMLAFQVTWNPSFIHVHPAIRGITNEESRIDWSWSLYQREVFLLWDAWMEFDVLEAGRKTNQARRDYELIQIKKMDRR
jgi:hypothetical protein